MEEQSRRIRDIRKVHLLYILESEGFYKIGYTYHLRKRLSAINTASPFDVKVIKYFIFNDRQRANDCEGHLHRLFDVKRIRSGLTGKPKEWFKLERPDLIRIDLEVIRFLGAPKAIPRRLEEAFNWSEQIKRERQESKKTRGAQEFRQS